VSQQFSFDIHGIVSVRSEGWLPELAEFRTRDPVDQPTICVRVGGVNGHRQRALEQAGAPRIVYDEGLGPLGFAAQITVGESIEVDVSPILRRSPHVLYTNVVEPILRWTLVERGYALVHGACLDFGGGAYLITARTDTGKTTTMLRILSTTDSARFIADDLTIVDPNGRVLTYPKPLTISQHTVSAINPEALSRAERIKLMLQSRVHSRPSRRLALLLARTNLPMATINTLIQWLVPPPKYHVQRLIPSVTVRREAQVAGMFVIERGEDGERSLQTDEAIQILLQNCDDAYGFPPYQAIEGFLCHLNGRDLRAAEQQIVSSAFRECPAVLLRSSQLDWWKRIREIVMEGCATDA
jgi:hypothetical protein